MTSDGCPVTRNRQTPQAGDVKNRPSAPARSEARVLRANGASPCALAIQRQQAFQDIGIARVLRPAVGSQDGLIEGLVGILKPLRALVVKVRQGALL